MTTFTQLNARLKNFLNGCLLAWALKEFLVECATSCIKSEVILIGITYHHRRGYREVKDFGWIKSCASIKTSDGIDTVIEYCNPEGWPPGLHVGSRGPCIPQRIIEINSADSEATIKASNRVNTTLKLQIKVKVITQFLYN